MRALNILLHTPYRGERGNGVTAERWRRVLTDLGHVVTVTDQPEQAGDAGAADLLVALHATRSHQVIERFRAETPERPVVVALTGTDLYRDLATEPAARASLDVADALVVLQPLAIEALPAEARSRAHVIHQSCTAPPHPPAPRDDVFEVCVVAHLRPVKAPLLAAEAAALLPDDSPVRIVHVGGSLDDELRRQAEAAAARTRRWRWLGPRPREQTLEVIASSRVLAITSILEGGANVVTEAIACGTPVVSTRIPGSVGLLGADYPGYVPPGDAGALARMLDRLAREPAAIEDLRARIRPLQALVDPARERRAWARLLAEVI